MKSKRNLAVLILMGLLMTLHQQNVTALSCAEPSVVNTIKHADVIFIGDLSPSDSNMGFKDGPKTYSASRYTVREAIKGTANGDVVTVYYNTTWGNSAPGFHSEGTFVTAAYNDKLLSLDCAEWSPMNDETAHSYGYKSVDYMKRDILLITATKFDEKTNSEHPSQDKNPSVYYSVLFSTLSALAASIVTVLFLNIKYKNKKQK